MDFLGKKAYKKEGFCSFMRGTIVESNLSEGYALKFADGTMVGVELEELVIDGVTNTND